MGQEAARTVNPLVNTSVGSTPTWPTIKGCDSMKPLPVGTVFANGWRILEHWNCAESVFNGLGGKNCTNDNCGATYAFENSNVRRWIDGEVQRLHVTTLLRISRQSERKSTESLRKLLRAVISDEYPSKLFTDHQCHVICLCSRCKGKHFMRYDDLRDGRLPCRGEGRSMLHVQKTLSQEPVPPQSASV